MTCPRYIACSTVLFLQRVGQDSGIDWTVGNGHLGFDSGWFWEVETHRSVNVYSYGLRLVISPSLGLLRAKGATYLPGILVGPQCLARLPLISKWSSHPKVMRQSITRNVGIVGVAAVLSQDACPHCMVVCFGRRLCNQIIRLIRHPGTTTGVECRGHASQVCMNYTFCILRMPWSWVGITLSLITLSTSLSFSFFFSPPPLSRSLALGI